MSLFGTGPQVLLDDATGRIEYRAGVLPYRTLAPARERCDLLMAIALEEHQCDLPFGRGQMPASELRIDRPAEPFERGLCARLPGIPFVSLFVERLAKCSRRMRRPPPAEPERRRQHQRARDHERLEDDVEGEPRGRLVHRQIGGAADDDRDECDCENPPQPCVEVVVHVAPNVRGPSVICRRVPIDGVNPAKSGYPHHAQMPTLGSTPDSRRQRTCQESRFTPWWYTSRSYWPFSFQSLSLSLSC